MNITKAIQASLNPRYWYALSRGVVPTIEHAKALRRLSPVTIFDVGANKGQFTAFCRNEWPSARIIAFEPLDEPANKFAAIHKNNVVLHRCALGQHNAKVTMHVASRVDSSSLLPLSEAQQRLYNMQEVSTKEVTVNRLVEFVDLHTPDERALLKIDVQGFEYEVLLGAEEKITSFSAIYIEASYLELYQGQVLNDKIKTYLENVGFCLDSEWNISFDADGNKIQSDLLFVR